MITKMSLRSLLTGSSSETYLTALYRAAETGEKVSAELVIKPGGNKTRVSPR